MTNLIIPEQLEILCYATVIIFVISCSALVYHKCNSDNIYDVITKISRFLSELQYKVQFVLLQSSNYNVHFSCV